MQSFDESTWLPVVVRVYLGQLVRDEGMLASDLALTHQAGLDVAIRLGHVVQGERFRFQVLRTSAKGSVVASKEILRRLEVQGPRLAQQFWQLPSNLASLLVWEVLTGHGRLMDSVRTQDRLSTPYQPFDCFCPGEEPNHLCILQDNGVRQLCRQVLDSLVDIGVAALVTSYVGTNGGESRGKAYMLAPEVEVWLRKYACKQPVALSARTEERHRIIHFIRRSTGFEVLKYGARWEEGTLFQPDTSGLQDFDLSRTQVNTVLQELAAHGGGKWNPGQASFRLGSYPDFAKALDVCLFAPYVEAVITGQCGGATA